MKKLSQLLESINEVDSILELIPGIIGSITSVELCLLSSHCARNSMGSNIDSKRFTA